MRAKIKVGCEKGSICYPHLEHEELKHSKKLDPHPPQSVNVLNS